MWISELESAQLGTVRIGTYATEQEAYDKTDKWLRETFVWSGKKKTPLSKIVDESFTDDVYIYENPYGIFEWEEDDD